MNNENLLKKYRKSILFYKYNISDILLFFFSFYRNEDYLGILLKILKFIADYFYLKCYNCKGYIILEIIGIILSIICALIHYLIIPLFFHYRVIKFYYDFLKKTISPYNKKLIIPIFIGIGLLFIIFLFPLIICHYLYTSIASIYGLIELITMIIDYFK